jgi:hypothetical protein
MKRANTNVVLILSIIDVLAMPSNAFSIDARPSNAVASVSSYDIRDKTRALSSTYRKMLSLSRGGGNNNGVNVHMNAATSSSTSTVSDDSKSREQTIAAAAFNLIKGCVGAGVLSLPAGVAAIGDVPKA